MSSYIADKIQTVCLVPTDRKNIERNLKEVFEDERYVVENVTKFTIVLEYMSNKDKEEIDNLPANGVGEI